MEKYLVSSAPYLRRADHNHTTTRIMIDLLIGLSPVILYSIFKNVVFPLIKGTTDVLGALYPLLTLVVSPIYSLFLEALCLYIMKKKDIKSFKDLIEELKVGYGIFPGLFIVLISPPQIKFWILLLSITIGEVVGKMLFGGFGQNIFNPAIVGRAFMAFAFSSEVSSSYLNVYEQTLDAYAGATPLIQFSTLETITYENAVSNFGSLLDFFIGSVPGSLAETSALCCIIGYIYLSVRKVIDYKVPLIYVATVFLNTLFIGLVLGQGIWYPTFNILSGGLMFGAVYMATEPVTSPKTNLGRIMNAMMLGVLTVLFRLVGNLPEGVATSIITMNIFSLVINKYCIHMRVDGKLDKNEVPGLVIFLVIFIGLFLYNIISFL